MHKILKFQLGPGRVLDEREGEMGELVLIDSPLIVPMERGGVLTTDGDTWSITWESPSSEWDFLSSRSREGRGSEILIGTAPGLVVSIQGSTSTKLFELRGITRYPGGGIWAKASRVTRKLRATPGMPEGGNGGIILHLGDELQSLPPDSAQPADDDPFI